MIHKRSLLFHIFLTVCVCGFLLSCEKEYNSIYDQSPDERLRKTLDAYNDLLLSAPHGWKGTLKTKLGPVFFYYFDFHTEGKVTMLADFNQTTAGTAAEGTWVLKALQRPTLSFDTYSYIHLPADPNGNVNGGDNGSGLLSDFQFAIASTAGDSIVLEGIQNKSSITLTKVTQPEVTQLTSGQMKNMLQYVASHKGLRLTLPDKTTIPLAISTLTKTIASQYLSADGSEIEEFTTPFTFSPSGISLTTAFTIAGASFKELHWDEDKQEFYVDATRRIINDNSLFILTPSIPLSSTLGSKYAFLQVPENTDFYPLLGQSDEFLSLYSQARESMLAGDYKLTLKQMDFVFKPSTHTLLIDVYVTQNGNLFLGQYMYTYELNEAGIFKFTFNQANDVAWAIQGDLSGLLSYIDNDTFTVKYIGGAHQLLGGMFSQENTNFSFSGYLGN
ncbi:DUF4302 domain-containing protein [Cytophagaceae bacterium YF14B1]|uniref:DUF4302 domain-containing protein n=1 Tax=Xanthocytophaga flava TaxID=3048013 RepID=A0AAE3QVA1_9BACT|nr:DUF4302 domain-containing protein [Xanthocytophaga flavus]MDJ1486030.1 DUF4302 domain-containing protein [Xanthocytophaga flavus]